MRGDRESPRLKLFRVYLALPLMTVATIVFANIAIQAWRDTPAIERLVERYRAAPVCVGGAASSCRRSESGTILRRYEQRNRGRRPIQWLSVRLADKSREIEMPRGSGSVVRERERYAVLGSGTPITAELFEGEVVSVRAGEREWPTRLHPENRLLGVREARGTGAFLSGFCLLGTLVTLWAWRYWRRRAGS